MANAKKKLVSAPPKKSRPFIVIMTPIKTGAMYPMALSLPVCPASRDMIKKDEKAKANPPTADIQTLLPKLMDKK